MLRFAAAFGLAVSAPALTSAETPAAQRTGGTPSCEDADMPFAATAANKLTGALLQQAVVGKTLVYLRKSTRFPGMMISNTREHRADGSMVYMCEYRRGDGPWTQCRSFGSVEKRVAGHRDVGVWSIRNENLCSAKAAFGERTEDCFAIHRQGGLYAAKRISGPRAACMQGTITFR